MCVPRWVALPGHVDLDQRALRLGDGGRRPHLEDGKTRLGHILFCLRLGHVGRGGWGRGRGRWREGKAPEKLGAAGRGRAWLQVGGGRMQEAVVEEHDQDAAGERQVDAAQCGDGIGVGQHRVPVGVPAG